MANVLMFLIPILFIAGLFSSAVRKARRGNEGTRGNEAPYRPDRYDRGNPYSSPPPVGTGQASVSVAKRTDHKTYERKEITRRDYKPTGSKSSQQSPTARSKPVFSMAVEQVFEVKNRGVAVTGTVKSGSLALLQEVSVYSPDGSPRAKAVVTAIEVGRNVTKSIQTGDEAAVLLDFGVNAGFIPNIGDVLAA